MLSTIVGEFAATDLNTVGPHVRFRGEANMIRRTKSGGSVENDPGCVKTLGGITAPEILGSTVMRRAKKRKNLSSARHYDQIRFCFHTTKTHNRRCFARLPAQPAAQ